MTRAELEAKIKALEDEIRGLNVRQSAYKQAIVASYGAMISLKNPMSDTDLGNAITQTGVAVIKKANDIAREFVKEKVIQRLTREKDEGNEASRRELVFINEDSKFEDVVVRNATDSAMLSLKRCKVKMFNGDKITPEGYALVEECGTRLNTGLREWYFEHLRTKRCEVRFKREKICDVGLWLESSSSSNAAKNSYVLHVLDNEGYAIPKFEYAGVKLENATLHQSLKDRGKEIVEHMILTRDNTANDRMVRQLFVDFKNMPIKDRSLIARCTSLKKYDNAGMDGYVAKTPYHVKAALNYNAMLDELGLTKYPKIKAGDPIHLVWLEKNKQNYDIIAFLDEWPPEFDIHFKVNNNLLFEKSIFTEIKRFYKSVGWATFNPADGYAFSLFDFAEMFSGNA